MKVAAVDYGGTWVRLLLTDHKNKEKQFLKVPSIPLLQLPSLIEKSLTQWKALPLSRLTIGAKGVWKQKKKQALGRKLKKFAKKVTVLSDVEFTYHSLFGNKPGILLIAGTGSIAYGKDNLGRWARAGGLGPKIGDEGSGYWIGKEYLQKSNQRKKSTEETRKVASLGKTVIQKAQKGDPSSLKIIQAAQKHLENLVRQVSKSLSFKNEFSLGLAGGLFKNKFFRKTFLQQFKDIPKIILTQSYNHRALEFHQIPKQILF